MSENKKGKEVDIMSTMKPIQATPELNGKDALKVLEQMSTQPDKNALERNRMLHSVLTNIRK